jgi:hypothetical protein
MAPTIKTTILPAGPTKRIWVNKHHLPQFGGGQPTSPVWEVEVTMFDGLVGTRYKGYRVDVWGRTRMVFDPEQPEHGPHAWVETKAEVHLWTAAEEAA